MRASGVSCLPGLALLAVMLAGPPQTTLRGQQGEGRVEGQVSGDEGQPLPQVVLVLTSQRGQLRRQTSSDSRGRFRFSGLSPGVYRLQSNAKGYSDQQRDELVLPAGGTLRVDFRLQAERLTLRDVEERGTEERNPNIFIRRVDLNALRDPLIRRGLEPSFLTFSAAESQFGRDLGAPIRQILFVRPSTAPSRLHASFYEAHENNALNARPFFNTGPLRPGKRHEFGAASEARLAADRLFFTTTLDFVHESGFVNDNIRVSPLDERTSTSLDPETNAIISALFLAFPPEDPEAPPALNTNAIRRIDSVDWNFRLDYRGRPEDLLAFQYTLFDYSEDPFEPVVGQNPQTDMRPQTFSASHTHSWSPRTLTRAAFQFDRLAAVLLPSDRFQALLAPLGLDTVPDISFGGNFASLTSIGPGSEFPREHFQNRFSGNLDVLYGFDRHQLRFGGRTTRIQVNDLQSDNSRGTFSFSDNFGRTLVENFRLGTPTTFSITAGDLYRGFRNWEHGLYVQDSFQIQPNFNLSLGLRYEAVTAPSEVNDRMIFDFDTDANNFGPHLALAWAPAGGRTVMRAGYGITFGHVYPGTYQTARFNPPAVRTVTVQNPSLTDPLQGASLEPDQEQPSEINLLDPELVSLYSHQYNLVIQRSLPQNLFFQIGYVGHRTKKPFFQILSNRGEPVPGIPATTATIDRRRPDPTTLRVQTILNAGTFYYDGLKVGLSRSLAQGLAFEVDYIFSKAFTDTTSDFSSVLNGEPGPIISQNNDDFFADLKAPSILDHRHILILQYQYRLPFGFDSSGLASFLLEGWRILGTTEYRTGRWFGLETSSDAPGFGNVDGEGDDRPNILNPAILGATIDDPDTSTQILRPEFFDTDLAPGGRGNLATRVFHADSVNNTNLALSKLFSFAGREELLEFRTEFQNFLNHPLFDRAGDVFPSDVFGKIVNTQNKGRVIKFLLRLSF